MQVFLDRLSEMNAAVNSVVGGPVMLILLMGTGVVLTVGSGFFQVRKFGFVMKSTVGGLFAKKDKIAKGAISPFQALSTALAGTIGVGNIAGVATAIVSGGPGAIFWMWASAFFGMMTKYAEVFLAVKFREKNASGEWSGGPMYYITNGLGKGWKWMAMLFSLLAMFASFGIGNLSQSNSIASAMENAFHIPPLWSGIIIAAITAIVIIGGVKRIGAITEKLVPFMSILYIIGALIVLAVNWRALPGSFGLIFSQAFSFRSVASGVGGYVIMRAMRYGVTRGIFSNEAGMGSAPIAHAAADTKGPVQQGLYGVFEVFMDTIVVCTLTALVVMTSGLFNSADPNMTGSVLTASSFSTVFGPAVGNGFVAVVLLFFAFSTIIGWSYYGTKCTEYLFGRFGQTASMIYKMVFVVMVGVGAVMELNLVWEISDTLNCMMAIPNLVALIALAPVVLRTTRDFFSNKAGLQNLDRGRRV